VWAGSYLNPYGNPFFIPLQTNSFLEEEGTKFIVNRVDLCVVRKKVNYLYLLKGNVTVKGYREILYSLQYPVQEAWRAM
jgi:hypothetical protein